MAEPEGSASAPIGTGPRRPPPSPSNSAPLQPRSRSPSPPPKSSTSSNTSSPKSPNTIMQNLLNQAKASAANRPPPPQQQQQPPTLKDLLDDSKSTTQFRQKVITNPKNKRHYKTQDIIGSSGGAVTVYNGVYCVNDSSELERMQHYDIYVALKVTSMENREMYEKLVEQVNKASPLISHLNLLLVKDEMMVQDRFWVVFLLMDGSLRSLLKSVYTNGVPQDLIAIVIKDVLEALAYLHGQGHVHQELNASHIYYRLDVPVIKLGYLATIYEHNSGDDGQALPGTLPVSDICEWAAAPEIYHLKQEYTDKSDVWLVGITALELAFGRIQVKNRQELEVWIAAVTKKSGTKKRVGKYIKKMIGKMKIGKSSSKKKDVTLSRAFKEMLALCFTEDAGERPTAADLLQHDFFGICDGVFDVYDFRNDVLAARERGMSVGTSSGSNVAGTSSGNNVAGASSGSNAVEGANP